jgi:type IV pilus assembly protein PilW
MSLVEMLVGVTVGLLIVAGAATLASTQWVENRRLLLEAQVRQDLRAAADLVSRELRRAGLCHQRPRPWCGREPGASAPSPNPEGRAEPGPWQRCRHLPLRPTQRPATGRFGYQLQSYTLRQRIGASAQDLTDPQTRRVTTFNVDLQPVGSVQLACPRLCSDGSQDCWPTWTLTDALITITGQAVSDATVSYTVVSRVRLRNDGVSFKVSATEVCP